MLLCLYRLRVKQKYSPEKKDSSGTPTVLHSDCAGLQKYNNNNIVRLLFNYFNGKALLHGILDMLYGQNVKQFSPTQHNSWRSYTLT